MSVWPEAELRSAEREQADEAHHGVESWFWMGGDMNDGLGQFDTALEEKPGISVCWGVGYIRVVCHIEKMQIFQDHVSMQTRWTEVIKSYCESAQNELRLK